MRTRNLFAALMLSVALAASGCVPVDLAPSDSKATPISEAAPESPSPVAPIVDDSPAPIEESLAQPTALAPVSTGPLNLGSYQGDPLAKLIVIGSQAVTVIALDGSVLETWILPGDLRTMVEGITHALGYLPTIVSHAPYSWDYDWGGLVLTDFSPSVTGAGDPPYKFTVTVRGIGVTQFRTTANLGVGDAASLATELADEVIDGGGYYWASVESFGVAIAGRSDARIYLEISAPSGAEAITEIRGPTGSWTS